MNLILWMGAISYTQIYDHKLIIVNCVVINYIILYYLSIKKREKKTTILQKIKYHILQKKKLFIFYFNKIQ